MDVQRFGTLVVIVDRARNLPNRKKIGKQDAYAIVRLGHEVQRTPTDKRAGQVPNWNHEVRFQVPSENENILKVSVFNEDSKVPDLIGDCAIDLSDLYKKHEYDNWFDLKYKDKPAGEIYAELTFYYEGPPRPKPKVEVPRPPSTDVTGRSLPSIPHTSYAMQPPMRQRTMSPTGMRTGQSRSDELHECMNSLSLRSPGHVRDLDYTNSPYTPGVRYAETWNGERDMRVLPPAPGNVRRKSFSSETPRPMQQEHTQVHHEHHSLPGPRRNSYVDHYDSQPPRGPGNTHRYAASQGNLGTRRMYTSGPTHVPGSVESSMAYHDPYSQRRSPVHERHTEQEQIQYVDPVLDPRHGSPHELRGSPSIASPRPEYLTRNDDPQVTRYPQPTHGMDLVGPQFYGEYGNAPHPAQMQDMNRHRMSPVLHNHFAAQSPQHAFGRSHDQFQSHPIPQHNKAASTSAMPFPSRASVPDAQYMPRRDARKSMDYASHSHDVSRQRRNTYAVTPAEYAARNRPLPAAPDAPPSLPAKIPLGLTREEYDILYGR